MDTKLKNTKKTNWAKVRKIWAVVLGMLAVALLWGTHYCYDSIRFYSTVLSRGSGIDEYIHREKKDELENYTNILKKYYTTFNCAEEDVANGYTITPERLEASVKQAQSYSEQKSVSEINNELVQKDLLDYHNLQYQMEKYERSGFFHYVFTEGEPEKKDEYPANLYDKIYDEFKQTISLQMAHRTEENATYQWGAVRDGEKFKEFKELLEASDGKILGGEVWNDGQADTSVDRAGERIPVKIVWADQTTPGTLRLGLLPANSAAVTTNYYALYTQGRWALYLPVAAVICLILSWCLIASSAGISKKRLVNGAASVPWTDRIYLEPVILVFLVLIVAMGFGTWAQFYNAAGRFYYPYGDKVFTADLEPDVSGCLGTAALVFGFWLFTSLLIALIARRKRANILRESTACHAIARAWRAEGKPGDYTRKVTRILRKQFIYNYLLFFASVQFFSLLVGWRCSIEWSVILSLLLLAVGSIPLLKITFRWFQERAKAMENLAAGAREVSQGKYTTRIDCLEIPELQEVANQIADISAGIQTAVKKELVSRNMKIELITNVSHDLKTPLTSIISYVDLLSKQELPEGQAREYVGILQEKSERLKGLIEDLFEISKAESKNMTVCLERISLNELLRQMLAEYEEKFTAQLLTIRMKGCDQKVDVFADGKLLWRVFSNLFGNVAKYALTDSRVYIELEKQETTAMVTVKNLSNYEMNFSAEEITQRFVRGDSSRTGDGTGLGLSIVDSFLQLMNGQCAIVVDGDLFKAMITLPLFFGSPETAPNESLTAQTPLCEEGKETLEELPGEE